MTQKRAKLPPLRLQDVPRAAAAKKVLLETCIHATNTYIVGNSAVTGEQLAQYVAQRIVHELKDLEVGA